VAGTHMNYVIATPSELGNYMSGRQAVNGGVREYSRYRRGWRGSEDHLAAYDSSQAGGSLPRR